VLILDEMNRTDLSRMLGECFSLLEDRSEHVDLPGHDGQGKGMTLRIPGDLYVVGTMNLIDQSVEQLDFALRRRFLWYFCPFEATAFLAAAEWRWNKRQTSVSWHRVESDFRRLAGAAQQLNQQIEESPQLGAQYQIGHTYLLDVVAFLADTFSGTTRASTFLWNRAGAALEPVQQLWDLSLQPLLEQYLAGLPEADRTSELKRLHKAFTKAAEPT
jgi:5-methylcytosine-specific restriction protein B